MNQIKEILFMFIINKDRFNDFSHFFEIVNEGESKDLDFLLKQQGFTPIKLKFENIEILNEFNPSYLNSELIEATYKDLTLNCSYIWLREVNHLYENHLEVEIAPPVLPLPREIEKEFLFESKSFDNWIGQIGKITEAKMIYIIEDYETYHLKWFNNEVKKIRLMNIEAFDNWEESFEAIKLMINNIAAHNKW